jgi:hypothetical protein
MTQIPSGDDPANPVPRAGLYDPAPRTSATSVTALVLGILLCIPFLTSLAAVLFGVVGIRATRRPGVRGRGLAIAGLTLGIVGLLGWSGIGGTLGLGWFQTSPDRAITTAFVHDLDSGNVSAAQAKCGQPITAAQIQNAAHYLKSLGKFDSYSNNSYSIAWQSGGSATVVIQGTAICNGNPHDVAVTFVHPSQGTPVIQGFRIQ